MTGRLTESETELPAPRYTLYCQKSPLGALRIENCLTSDDGRFTSNRNRFTIDLTHAKPGNVLELGDVAGPN